MKAVRFHEYGSAEVLDKPGGVGSAPRPRPNPTRPATYASRTWR